MIGAGGRGVVWCAAAFLTGNVAGNLLLKVQTPADAAIALAVWCMAAAIAAVTPLSSGRLSNPWPEWVALLVIFIILGAVGSLLPETVSARTDRREEIAGKFEDIIRRNATKTTVTEDEIGVLKALSTGDRSGLSRIVKNNFRASGATHLLALSGLHVGVIYKLMGFLLAILGRAPWAKRVRSIVTLAFLWWFAVITGLSPSIFRAVLMITIYEAGALLGRGSDGLNSLAASAIIITLLDPQAPMELSFQMSFCACLSIFTIFPKLNSMLDTSFKPLKYIWDCATLAISCQMTTGVIAWLKFGTFPRYFIISNLLTVPLVGVIMYLIAATIITAGIPGAGEFFADALITATRLLNATTGTIAQL